jgi:hypothetical protein
MKLLINFVAYQQFNYILITTVLLNNFPNGKRGLKERKKRPRVTYQGADKQKERIIPSAKRADRATKAILVF